MERLAILAVLFLTRVAAAGDCATEPEFPGLIVRAGAELGKGRCPVGSANVARTSAGAHVTCRDVPGLEERWWKPDASVDSFTLISSTTPGPLRRLTWEFDSGRLERVGSACSSGGHDVVVTWFGNGALAMRSEHRNHSPVGTWTRFERPGVPRKRLLWNDGGTLDRVELLYPGGGVSARGTGESGAPSLETDSEEDAERWALLSPDGGPFATITRSSERRRFELTARPSLPLEKVRTFVALPNSSSLSEHLAFGASEAQHTFTSQGPNGHRLRVEVALSFRACLERDGVKPACVSSSVAGAGLVVAWSTGGFVWLSQLGHPDSPFGDGVWRSWVWSLVTHRLIRTYDGRPTQLLGGSHVAVSSVEPSPVNPGGDCRNPGTRCLGHRGRRSVLDDLRARRSREVVTCGPYLDALPLCAGSPVDTPCRGDGRQELLRVATASGVRECFAQCSRLPELGGLIVTPDDDVIQQEKCQAAFADGWLLFPTDG